MGMFDSVVVSGLACQVCEHVTSDLVEVQFKAYVKRTYSPTCETVRVGEALSNFPRIPVCEVGGCWSCPECDHFHSGDTMCHKDDEVHDGVCVRIERGVVVSVVAVSHTTHSWVVLPRPRDPERIRRRRAAEEEAYRRRVAAIPADERWATIGLGLRLARLDYGGLARSMFKVEPLGTQRIGPYRKFPGHHWERG